MPRRSRPGFERFVQVLSICECSTCALRSENHDGTTCCDLQAPEFPTGCFNWENKNSEDFPKYCFLHSRAFQEEADALRKRRDNNLSPMDQIIANELYEKFEAMGF